LLEIQLQEKIRPQLKNRIADPKVRSKTLYDILNSVEVKAALMEGQISEAEELALQLIQKDEVKQ